MIKPETEQLNPFVGRTSELDQLKAAWETAKLNQPSVVTLLADTGFGKTRLVHEFYKWLVEAETGDADYWPPDLDRQGANLDVNPAVEACRGDAAQMPFLWWGIRVEDRSERNAVGGSAVRAATDALRPHLGAIEASLRESERRTELKKGRKALAEQAFSFGVSFIPVAGAVYGGVSQIKSGYDEIKKYRELKSEQDKEALLSVSPTEEGARVRNDLVATLVADLAHLAKSPPDGMDCKPLVVFLDDIQFADADAGLADFVALLLERAEEENWPLLLIVNCWSHRWPGSPIKALVETFAKNRQRTLDLGKSVDLGALVSSGLPGLSPEQKTDILKLADGNPRFLEVVIAALRDRPKYFEGRDPDGALNASGLDYLKQFSLSDLISERLKEAGPAVRETLSIASVIGMRFFTPLVLEAGRRIGRNDAEDGLKAAADPQGIIALDHQSGRFLQRAYYQACRDDADNHFEAEDLARALAEASQVVGETLMEDADRETYLADTFHLFRDDPDADKREEAWRCLDELTYLSLETGDLRAGFDLATLWHQGYQTGRFTLKTTHAPAVDRVAGVLVEWGQSHAAIGLRLELLDVLLKANEKDPCFETALDYSIELSNLAELADHTEGVVDIEPLLRSRLALWRDVAEMEGDVREARELCLALTSLGTYCKSNENIEEAALLYEEAALRIKTLHLSAGHATHPEFLALTLVRAAQLHFRLNAHEKAHMELREGLEIAADPALGPDMRIGIYFFGIQALEDGGLVDEVDQLYRRLTQELDGLDARGLSDKFLPVPAAVCMTAGRFFDDPTRDPEKALHCFEEAVRFARTAFSVAPGPSNQDNLAKMLLFAGHARMNRQDLDGARPLLEEGLRLCSEVRAIWKSAASNEVYSMAMQLFGRFHVLTGNPASALAYLQHDLTYKRELFQTEGGLPHALLEEKQGLMQVYLIMGKTGQAQKLLRSVSELVDRSFAELPNLKTCWYETTMIALVNQKLVRRLRLFAWLRNKRRQMALFKIMSATLIDRGLTISEALDKVRTGDGLDKIFVTDETETP